MTYKPPNVEEELETDNVSDFLKRKRVAEETPITGEEVLDTEGLPPPNKAAKGSETPLGDPLDDGGLDDAEADILDDLEDFDDEGIFEEEDVVEGGEEDKLKEAEAEDEALQNEVEAEVTAEALEEEEEAEAEAEADVVELIKEVEAEAEAEAERDEEEEIRESPGELKLNQTIERFGRAPLEGTAISEEPLTASADTVLAMLIDAMLKSRPISHELSQRAVSKLIDVGLHDIRKLGDSSWEERTTILQDGGYNRYREQGATNLGELFELVDKKYDGDLNNLLKKAEYDRKKTRELVKEVKGLGDLGVDLFFNNVQSVWPSIAPFVDSRSLKTAREAGIETDLDAIFADLEEDSMRMSKLANALSAARLEKRMGDLVAI